MTSAQLATLEASIVANMNTIPTGYPWTGSFAGLQIKNVPNSGDGNVAVAGWYNLPASPNFTVWHKNVTITQIGDNIVGTELAGLSSLNNTRLQSVIQLSADGVNPSLSDRRAFFDDIFSGTGGVQTRAKLLILWKRLATNVQKLFSTGTGIDAAPATTAADVGDGFMISGNDVGQALG